MVNWGNLLHGIHSFDLSVTVQAVDAAVDVHAVVEVGIVRDAMHALPGQFYAFFKVLCEFDNLGAVFRATAWQFMHTETAGTVAWGDVVTAV